MELLKNGVCNLKAHVGIISKQFGLPVVVAVNRFTTDSQAELELIRSEALNAGAFDACITDNWSLGGEGAASLADAVIKACSSDKSNFKFLYDLNMTIKVRIKICFLNMCYLFFACFHKEKIECIAKNVYGAANVVYSDLAEDKIKVILKHYI